MVYLILKKFQIPHCCVFRPALYHVFEIAVKILSKKAFLF